MVKPTVLLQFFSSFVYSFYFLTLIFVNFIIDMSIYWQIGLSVYIAIEMLGAYLFQRRIRRMANQAESDFLTMLNEEGEE